MEIFDMTSEHDYWEEVADFAERCSWDTGKVLAERMRKNDFKADERVFAVFEKGKPVDFCTLTDKDALPPKYLYKPFIGFVFVDEMFRGSRISEKMIEAVKAYSRMNGYGRIYLTSGEKGLYEKYGFVKLGDYETIYGTVEQLYYIVS